MPSALSYLLVGLGGALGAIARFAASALIARRFPSAQFPIGTLVINLSGCLLIAAFLSAAANRVSLQENLRYLFPIGFVGAYTTFSTYEWELWQLGQQRAWGTAALYFLLSNAVGFAAIAIGDAVGKRL